MEWHPIQTELENLSRGCSQVPQGGEGSGYTREFCSHRLQKLPLNLSSTQKQCFQKRRFEGILLFIENNHQKPAFYWARKSEKKKKISATVRIVKESQGPSAVKGAATLWDLCGPSRGPSSPLNQRTEPNVKTCKQTKALLPYRDWTYPGMWSPKAGAQTHHFLHVLH